MTFSWIIIKVFAETKIHPILGFLSLQLLTFLVMFLLAL